MSYLAYLNRLLPFATPGTPLIQDLVHLGAICLLFYFGPQIQQWVNRPQDDGQPEDHDTQQQEEVPAQTQAQPQLAEEQPIREQVPEDVEQPVPAIGQAGPAHAVQQRNVGAKKAKNLERKDQRRAYHEFMRSQGEAQRARDAEGAEEREAALAVEQERRRAAEKALHEKQAKERERRRQKEESDRQMELERRESAMNIVKRELDRRKACDLLDVARLVGDEVDDAWVEKVLRASTLLGRRDDTTTMITGTGWVVRVTAQDMKIVYRELGDEAPDQGTEVTYEALATTLENVLVPDTAG